METIKRAFDTNNVSVMVTSSDLYAPYVGVLVESIIENSSTDNNYDILILQTDISEANVNLLEGMAKDKSNVSVRCVDISEIIDSYEFTTFNKAHKKYNFYRLCALEVLPEYDKLIYLDSDLVLNADIAELYNIDIGDNYLAATKCLRMSVHMNNPNPLGGMDIPMRDYLSEEVGLKVPEDYFNSGVMLFSLDNMRRDFTSRQLLDISTNTTFATAEQDVLNKLCEGKVVFLPQIWNYLCEKGNGMEQNADKALYDEWVGARSNNKIWHYVGGGSAIPCNRPTVDGAEYFWKYAYNTPFIDVLFERMDNNSNSAAIQQPVIPVVSNDQSSLSAPQQTKSWKRIIKKMFPYGSAGYISLKKKYFKLKRKPYDPNLDITNAKIMQKNQQRIKIFVSRRIDKNSTIINNPIFQDVRCGAVFDKSPSYYLGDNTGDNISQLRVPFCELTVMYWAWKNEDADYYGLCHYRRFPTFISKSLELSYYGVATEGKLTDKTIKKYKLNDQKLYEKKIPQADIWIAAGIVDVEKFLTTKNRPMLTTVFDILMCREDLYNPSIAIVTLKLIDEICPQFSSAAHRYLKSTKFYAYNCFVMKKQLFNMMCEFMFPILFRLNEMYNFSLLSGNKQRTPGYMSEFLYGVFISWAIEQGYNVKTTPLVLFLDTDNRPPLSRALKAHRRRHRRSMKNSHYYRALIDNNNRLKAIQHILANSSEGGVLCLRKTATDRHSLTANTGFSAACFAEQLHSYHKAAFAEFKNCNTGKSVAIIASGPTMKYYSQIPDIAHIGMNASFLNPNVKLDYYFTTDYEARNAWFSELKNYDFIKFFGQYSTGIFQNKYQVTEQIIYENNGRRFFQSAPDGEIHIDIEFYPLIGYYTIALQAIQFAIYTNAKRIYLIGCDCNTAGYFDGSSQSGAATDFWLRGYIKLKAFIDRFYPEIEIISVNPCGLRGLFNDVYTEDYLADNPDIDRTLCKIVDLNEIETNME